MEDVKYNRIVSAMAEIKAKGYAATLVGGCVRDMILGKTPSDYDVATNCPMEVLESMFQTVDIGKNKDFGVVVIFLGDTAFEVAQYRLDSSTSADGRHPDKVEYGCTFKEDSSRRDFTINAMALDEHGRVIDYHDGMKDLKDGIIRTVGNPMERFEEDKLRILRAVRFSAVLGFKIEEETSKAIKEAGIKCVQVSAERIRQELYKVASAGGKAMARWIEILSEHDILKHVFPELEKMKGCLHKLSSHPEGATVRKVLADGNLGMEREDYDPHNPAHNNSKKYQITKGVVYDHLIYSLRTVRTRDPLVVLGTMFHDIGKPIVMIYDDEGNIRYRGHDQGIFFNPIAERLKFSEVDAAFIRFCIDNHMSVHDLVRWRKSKATRMISDPWFPFLMEVVYADVFCAGERGRAKKVGLYEELCKYADQLRLEQTPTKMKRITELINGRFILDVLPRVRPGPAVGKLKTVAIDYAMESELDPEAVGFTGKVRKFLEENWTMILE